jgi:hypothetical protein
MAKYGWQPKSFRLNMDRTVAECKGPDIILDDDLVVELNPSWGSAEVIKYVDARIKNILISGLRFTSAYVHPEDEAHAKSAIELYNCKCVTVSNIAATVVQTLVYADYSARFIHVSNCKHSIPVAQDVGQRMYSYNINGTNCLVEKSSADKSRHSFVSGARALGPNVFYKCVATNERNDSGPHQRHAAGFLYDNVDAYIRVQNRGESGTGHGITGVWHVLWNTSKTKPVAISSVRGMFYNFGRGISTNNAKFLVEGQGERFALSTRGTTPDPPSLFEFQRK